MSAIGKQFIHDGELFTVTGEKMEQGNICAYICKTDKSQFGWRFEVIEIEKVRLILENEK